MKKPNKYVTTIEACENGFTVYTCKAQNVEEAHGLPAFKYVFSDLDKLFSFLNDEIYFKDSK